MTRALAAVMIMALVAGCGGGPDPDQPTQVVEPVVLAPGIGPASGDLPALPEAISSRDGALFTWVQQSEAGFEPCGCVSGMFGGLVRRASLMTRVGGQPVIAIEGGGWVAGDKDFQLIKTEHYLQALPDAGVAHVAIGRREVGVGARVLKRLVDHASGAGLTVLACNLQSDAGTAVATTKAMIDRDGVGFLLTAVVPADAAGTGLVVADPVPALQQLVATAGDRQVVVCADLDEDGLRALARAVPGIALIIGGDVHAPTPEPLREGGAVIIAAGNHGKTVGWWRWQAPAVAYELLADTIPEAPAIRQRIMAYQEALGAADLAIDRPGGAGMTMIGQRRATYVGSTTCAACHQSAMQMHIHSRHGHAYESLHGKGYHRDPECLVCHVTGLGQASGYTRVNAPDHLRQVSCESCHGAGSEHVASGGQTALQPVTSSTCITCHDQENSPSFVYDVYWPRIDHGLDAKEAP